MNYGCIYYKQRNTDNYDYNDLNKDKFRVFSERLDSFYKLRVHHTDSRLSNLYFILTNKDHYEFIFDRYNTNKKRCYNCFSFILLIN